MYKLYEFIGIFAYFVVTSIEPFIYKGLSGLYVEYSLIMYKYSMVEIAVSVMNWEFYRTGFRTKIMGVTCE